MKSFLYQLYALGIVLSGPVSRSTLGRALVSSCAKITTTLCGIFVRNASPISGDLIASRTTDIAEEMRYSACYPTGHSRRMPLLAPVSTYGYLFM